MNKRDLQRKHPEFYRIMTECGVTEADLDDPSKCMDVFNRMCAVLTDARDMNDPLQAALTRYIAKG